MAIEDLLVKAHHKDIAEHASHIQDALEGARLELLATHYIDSLSPDKRKEFENLTEMERNIRLAQNDYKLPQDQAEAFLMDIVHRVLVGVSPKKAENMKKFMDVLKDKNATPEQLQEAHREIDHFLAIANSYGIRMDILERGKEQGFSPDLFRGAVGNYGKTYNQKEKGYWLKQITNDVANKYLSELKQHDLLKDFNYELVKEAPVEDKRDIIASHYDAKKQEKEGGLELFKKAFDKYFKKPEEKK